MININPQKEKEKIIKFIKTTLKREGFEKVVIGLSGGVDSTASFYLLKEAVNSNNIIPVCLYYSKSSIEDFNRALANVKIPQENIYKISIKEPVSKIKKLLKIKGESHLNRVRLGNIMTRVRMIALFDLAKRHNALVCGTENKSEHYLGYFTRFGDEASDFEPIRHLYKTQVYELAAFLGVPDEIIKKQPTAGLWPDQSDQKELGFSYQEADPVLYFYFEKKLSVDEIKKRGFEKAAEVISWALRNKFKHHVPYTL